MNGLIAHGDTIYTTEERVRAVSAVPFTASWRPIHHAVILDTIGAACEKQSLVPLKRTYSLSANGHKMFGLWDFGKRYGFESSFALGIRNSMDKSMAVGLAVGMRVFVCDNLAFSGDVVLFRKHSGLLTSDELYALSCEAIEKTIPRFDALGAWEAGLTDYSLHPAKFSYLTLTAVALGIIPGSSIRDFIQLRETVYPQSNLRAFHGAATDFLTHAQTSLIGQFDKQRKLVDLCNAAIRLRDDPCININDFVESIKSGEPGDAYDA